MKLNERYGFHLKKCQMVFSRAHNNLLLGYIQLLKSHVQFGSITESVPLITLHIFYIYEIGHCSPVCSAMYVQIGRPNGLTFGA